MKRLALGVALALVACNKPDVVSALTVDAPVETKVAPSIATSIPSGSPLSRLVPAPRPGPRDPCPLTIEPGVAFGPVQLGETLAVLEAGGLTVKRVSDTHAEIVLAGGETLKVTLCEGKIIDIWIDDLRKAPACVAFGSTKIAPTIDRPDLEKLLGGCSGTAPRIGGAFERCQDGGVYVGHGMGTFLQIRVRPKSFPFDDACAIAKDDGAPIVLAPTVKNKMLESTLLMSELSPYWHPKVPGRDPLRIVRTPLIAEHNLMMFGSTVLWIDEADAKSGTAFFRITKLSATKTKATLTFEYPIEGVRGSVTFAQRFGEWRYESGEVREK